MGIMSNHDSHLQQIEQVMIDAQRTSWRGIMPDDVLKRLDDATLTEKAVRAEMDALVKMGRLVKVGKGAARGYRLATASQRAKFEDRYRMRPMRQSNVSWYSGMVYDEIESAVRNARRDLRRGIFPADVQPRLPFEYRAEGSLRRDMLAMVTAGRLIRIGGPDARQGYRLPTRLEKLAFALNGGMWPHGAEYVVSWA